MPDITNPHDAFFQSIFSRADTARDFVGLYLPTEIVAELDLDTLEATKDSFVDDELRRHFSDLLFRVQLRTGQPGYVYLLFEHKTRPEPRVGFQLLRYAVRIWEQYERSAPRAGLPPIFSVVLFHGTRRWNVSTRFQSLIEPPEAFAPYVPDFQYHLCDLSSYTDDDIRGVVVLKTALLAMKHIFEPDLRDRLPVVLGLLRELATQRTGLEYLETLLRYLASASDALTAEDLHEALATALPDMGDTIMSTLAEKWMEEGHTRGEAALLVRQLELKFGLLTPEHRARIDAADAETLLVWGERILTAKNIEAVFAD